MSITSDWHIHSRNSCDEASLAVADLIRDAARHGIRDYGLTDHAHTRCNLPDIAASREEYLAHDPSPRFHFGVEVSSVSQWEIDEIARGGRGSPTYGLREGGPPGAPLAIGIAAEDVERLGIEYVVGGAHWPMYVPIEREAVIRDYHRQNMFLATHPLVDVVAHPWWWWGAWRDSDGMFRREPWLDDFGAIPRSMHDEFAAAARQHGKAVEVNIGAMLLNPFYPEPFRRRYVEYLAALKAAGVPLSIGSDCHSDRYDVEFDRAEEMLATAGVRDDELWRLPPRTDGAHQP